MDKLQEKLNQLAREHITDNPPISQNRYFVSDQGNVVLISDNFQEAYNKWKRLSRRVPKKECDLEDRRYGSIASVEPDSAWKPPYDKPNEPRPLVVHDDSRLFLNMYPQTDETSL